MGTGFVLNITQETINRLKDADEKITQLAKTSENAQTKIVSAFQQINTQGIDAFINKLTEAQNRIVALGNTKVNIGAGMFSDIGGKAKSVIDEVNRVVSAIEKIKTVTTESRGAKNPFVDNGLAGSIAKLNAEIEQAKRNFSELQNRFTHLSSPAGDKTAVTTIQNEAQFLMQYINLLEKERNSLIVAKNALANANKMMQQKDPFKAKVDDLSRESLEALRYKDSMQAMKEFYTEQDKERKKAAKEAEADRKKREKEEKAAADRIAAYDSKARRERYKAYTSTYEGAMRTSDRAKTLLQEQQAIKNLEAARAKLNKTDSDYANKLRNLNQRILEHKKNIDKATAGSKNLQAQHRSLMDISGQLARRLALVFSVSQITGYVKKLIEVRGEFELQQRSLQAILQDKDKANEIWQKTVDLAVRSPFRVKQLVSYTKQLAAYRIESDKLFETNKMLADISAGLGVDMQRLILAFGQVRSAAYLRGTELRQFTEAGIPILEQLAQYFTELEGRAISVGDVFERVSKRMVSFADVEEIFKRMTSEGGTFFQMQEIQAKTLKGMWTNLMDSIDLMLNEIGKANEGTLKGSIQSVKGLVDGWRDLAFAIKLVLVPLGTYLSVTAAIRFANNSFSHGLLLMAMNTKNASKWILKAEKGIVGFITKMGLGKKAAAGFVKMLGGLASLGVAGAIAGIVVGLVALVTKLTSASRAAKQLNKDLQSIYNEDTSNLKTQVRSFKSLVERLKDVNEGSREHEEIISQLNSQYGEYIGFVVDEKTTYDQLASSIDSVTLALTRKAKMNTFEKAYSKTLESTNKQIAELEDRITKQAFKTGMTFNDGKTPLVPTQEEIEDIFGLIEKKVRETGKTITSYEQINEIVSEYYGKDVEVAGTAIKNFTDLAGYYLKQKEAELELDKKINDVYGDRLRSSAEARQAFADLEERQAKALKAAEKEPKWVKEDIRNQFAKEKIDLEVRYEGLDEATAELRKETLDSMSATIKDVNKKIKESDLGEKYANLIYIDTNEASKSLNEIAESTATSYKAQQDIIKQQNALKEAGTVYDAKMLENAELSAEAYYYKLQLLGRLDLLSKGEDKKENASVKILQRRINLLKEVHKKYLELEKTFGSQTAEKKIIEAYSDTFKEAFEGTGVDLDLYKVMTQTIVEAEKLGTDAGSALTEGMLSKLKELEGAGTYIRTFSKDLVDAIKKNEGFRAKAYRDGGGVWTQGYGETQGVERDKEWTREYAEQRLRLRLTNDYAAAVNKVLDANRDLIVTQEQYNALVDLAYQGGGGAVKSLVNYAKNIEKGASYIERISKKIKATMGEEAAARFGETFVRSFKEAETIQERMALLLQTMNLTIAGKINKGWYEGMQKRSDERAAMFSGDLDVAKKLETVLVRIAGMDFKTTEGMVKALSQLKSIAEKEGPEAQKILSQAISGLEAEIGLRIKKEEDEKLKNKVQELFDRYDLSLELKKLNIPPKLAKSLFDVDYLNLDGLKEAVQEQGSKFIGTDMEKEYKKFLDKIDDMDAKAAKERMKTYSKYLLEGMSERVKLKIEEMRKLKEIEESKEFNPDQKKRIKEGISQEAKKAQQSQEWKDFKSSDMYTMIFEDLEHYGTVAIDALYKKLTDLKTKLSDLPANEVKDIMSQIEKLENIKIERNPFKEWIKYAKDIKDIGFSQEELQGQLIGLQDREAFAQGIIDVINLVQQAIADGADETTVLAGLTPEQLTSWRTALGLQQQIGGTLGDVVKKEEKVVKKSKEQQGVVAGQLSNYKKLSKAQEQSYKKTELWLNTVGDVFGASKELMTALGAESDSVAMTIADTGSSMVSLTLSAVQFTLQLQAMGVAANSALGVIGWFAIALQAVATLLSAIFSAKDNALKKQVEGHQRTVENLLESYEELEKKIDEAWSVDAIRQFNAEMKNTMSLAIDAKKAAIAAQEQRKGANKEGSDNWQELQDMKAELDEMEQQLEDSLKKSFSKITDGILDDVFDAAKEFTDAWYEAFKETGDGLSGLEENFNEMFMNLAKNQAAGQITGAFVEEWKRDLQKYLNDTDTRLTPEGAKAWAEEVKDTMPELSAALEAFLGTIHEGLDGGASGLSALSKSIQGVSESTAQVLESLLSSMRFYVADSNAKLTQLLNNMRSGETESPMLAELRAQTKWMRDIYNLINGMTTTHPSGGRGIKTVM